MPSKNVERAERIMSSMPPDTLADAIRDTRRVEEMAAMVEGAAIVRAELESPTN